MFNMVLDLMINFSMQLKIGSRGIGHLQIQPILAEQSLGMSGNRCQKLILIRAKPC